MGTNVRMSAARSELRARRPHRSMVTPVTLPPDVALQVFLFNDDVFVGAELFSAARPVVIGRHPQVGLRLQADTVSRRHCRITFNGNHVWIDDLGSGNGTFVNDEPVQTSRRIGFPDTVRIGPFTLKIRPLVAAPLEGPIDPILAQKTTRIEAVASPVDVRFAAPPLAFVGNDEADTEQGARPATVARPVIADSSPRLGAEVEARLRDLNELIHALDQSDEPGSASGFFSQEPSMTEPDLLVFDDVDTAANDDPATERVAGHRPVRRSRATSVHESRLMTPTEQQVKLAPHPHEPSDDVWTDSGARLQVPTPSEPIGGFERSLGPVSQTGAAGFRSVEVAARVDGRLVSFAALRDPFDEYILGYPTPQGPLAPARQHLGLRLVKINEDRTVDLVFPNDVGGHLIRGPHIVSLNSLTEGRKYSCLRLHPADIATVYIGRGRDAVSYHLRFIRRPASLIRALKQSTRS